MAERIFQFSSATGRAERNIAADLRGTLTAVETTHFAAITQPDAIGQLLRAIDSYQGHVSVQHALRLAPQVFVRPGELRAASWSEFDLKMAEWVIPEGELLFPGLRSTKRPISDNSLNAALRRMDYAKDKMTAHGFRTTASTCLHELGFASADIEMQLAQFDSNKIRAIYNRAERLPERRKMMQAWSDYLDGLRNDEGQRVVALNRM